MHPEMRKPYEYGWFTAVVDRTGLSLVSVESQIEVIFGRGKHIIL